METLMEIKQLALFDLDEVVGTGQPIPWPTPAAEPEGETPQNPDQMTFDEDETEAAA